MHLTICVIPLVRALFTGPNASCTVVQSLATEPEHAAMVTHNVIRVTIKSVQDPTLMSTIVVTLPVKVSKSTYTTLLHYCNSFLFQQYFALSEYRNKHVLAYEQNAWSTPKRLCRQYSSITVKTNTIQSIMQIFISLSWCHYKLIM